MKRKLSILLIFTVLSILLLNSCSSTPDSAEIIRSTGTNLGTVTARAEITVNRATGETTGDTKNYGYIIESTPRRRSEAREKIEAAVSTAMEKAYAIAMYEIIQKVKEMGGDAVNDVVSGTHREYDMDTRIESVTVTITASAIKTGN